MPHTVTYHIHLPTGKVITAHGGQELDKIISMNVCRVFSGRQIRIEPEYETNERSEQARTQPANTNKQKDFQRRLQVCEKDCTCFDCNPLTKSRE